MRPSSRPFVLALMLAVVASTAFAQGSPSTDRVIRMNGALPSGTAGPASVEFSIYDQESGGALLWQETQVLAVDAQGGYSVLLGATAEGLPADVFAGGAARWLRVRRSGGPDAPRTLLTAVPYALSAVNADTLGGRPATDFVLVPSARRAAASDSAGTADAAAVDRDPGPLVNNGTAGFIGKFFNTVDLDNSNLFQSGLNVGLGTTTPFDTLHTRFLNTAGSATGYAVQNLGSTANSYSGMLFYDHTGALRQFQGYNNGTGEYRINNISPTGSINFLIGNSSQFKVTTSGDIGLGAGTNTPDVKLHMFSNGVDGVTMRGSRLAGTIVAPTAITNGSTLLRLEASGYNGSAYSQERAMIRMASTEGWSTTANGTAMEFYTTPNGSTAQARRLLLTQSGQFGVNATPGVWEVNAAIGFTADLGPAPGESFSIQNVGGSTAGYLNLNGSTFSGIWLSRANVNKWRIITGTSGDSLIIGDDGGTSRLTITQAGAITLGGNTTINGTFTATGAKSFTIDHPLDPEHKVLRHAAAESNEVINFYSGNVTTDAAGKAVVGLPAYFEIINKDYRYQLTVIGAFAQAIVSREVTDNQFEITTSVPNIKVSWEVKGVRNDQYMRDHPYVSEEAKPTTTSASADSAAVDAAGRPVKR